MIIMDYIEEGLLSKKINKKRIDNLDLIDKKQIDDELSEYKDKNGNYPNIKDLDNGVDKIIFGSWMAEKNKHSHAKKINKTTDKDYIKFGIKNAIRNAKRGRLLGLGRLKAKKIDKKLDGIQADVTDPRSDVLRKNVNPDAISRASCYTYRDIIRNKLSNTSDKDIIKQELKKKEQNLIVVN